MDYGTPAIIGQADQSEGEVPIGFVTLKRQVAEKAIEDSIRPFLKPWEMPIRIIMLGQMPLFRDARLTVKRSRSPGVISMASYSVSLGIKASAATS